MSVRESMSPTACRADAAHGRARSLLPLAALGAAILAISQASLVPAPSSALAQSNNDEPLTTTPFNASEQRKQMIEQLRAMNERLSRIETKLAQPLDVRVKEMPPIQIPPAPAPGSAPR